MSGLLTDFYPLTFSWGALEAKFDDIANFVGEWRRRTRKSVSERGVSGSLEEMLSSLDPLTIPPTQDLIVETKSGWVAWFQNGLQGGADAPNVVSYVARELHCRGVAVRCIPNTMKGGRGVYGAVSFELFAPHPTDFLNYLRSIAAANDGGKWVFTATGEVQEFEEQDQYKARKIADRFTPAMLERYGKGIGLDLFSPPFYSGPAKLIAATPEGGVSASVPLREAKARYRISS